MTQDHNIAESDLQKASELIQKLQTCVHELIVGQKNLVDRLIMALIVEGHVLLEGLPGLAKTTAVRALSRATSLSFSRIQFTPDLLPADVVGTQIFDQRELAFKVKKGPLFAHIVLADEINRAPAKVQSALLEAMQERQVTIGSETFPLDRPFLVLATQNPIEQEGTYPLPEAQVDRFLFKVVVHYGSKQEELDILAKHFAPGHDKPLIQVASAQDIKFLTSLCQQVYVSEKIREYIVNIVFATREKTGLSQLKNYILCGASPRASIALEQVARAQALFKGRNFVHPQDIKDIAYDVLRHRIIPSFEANAEGMTTDHIISQILETVSIP